MKLIISHPTSNEVNKAAVDGLLEAELLSEFYTSIASFPGTLIDYIGRAKPFIEIQRRNFKSELRPYTKTFPLLEVGRQLALKLGFSKLLKPETGFFSLDSVYQHMDKRVASRIKHVQKNGAKGVFAYEDGALFSFREAKRVGLQCFYDAPIGYWRAARRLMAMEIEQWPDWAPTLSSFADSLSKLASKDEELLMADLIFVASRFTADTLKEFPGLLAPVRIIPYGFPKTCDQREYSGSIGLRPFKILFVGGLSQRKGLANLFAAVETFGRYVELTIVGRKQEDNCLVLDKALSKHKWIPSLSHVEVLKLMREHDVLILPSLFEGFGLVITEAMSQGTPVITTERTAGPDLIEHGVNGWLVEAGSINSLQTAIENILVKPASVAVIGKLAIEAARKRPWNVYKRDITNAIKEHFASTALAK